MQAKLMYQNMKTKIISTNEANLMDATFMSKSISPNNSFVRLDMQSAILLYLEDEVSNKMININSTERTLASIETKEVTG